ncbi:MAG TPA: glutamate--cysteine ligase [Gammaproteobacteria bacterium]|nr:glutamate--cysteine ligase [Gammaproteobacteria bacterium]
MLEARLRWLEEPGNARLIRLGRRGLEKESLRVDAEGRLSGRRHPEALGSALTHPNLTTDYSEALLEFVTPPEPSNWQTLQWLFDLHAFVHRRLDGELLWPNSMPCMLNPGDEIPIAEYGTSHLGRMKTVYRRGLGHRYGRSMQAIAGVHFNFSPPAEFWPAYREREGSREAEIDFRSSAFMGLARNYRRLAWLAVYLFGASPAFGKSFRPEGHPMLEALDDVTWYAPYATSLRMSDLGYRNKTQARLNISLNSAHDYIEGLRRAVTTVEPRYEAIGVHVDGEYRQLNANILQIENEYYSPIRPKPGKRSVSRPTVSLRRDGIEYVEVRTLDLSPADPVGVNQNELRFLETLLAFCLLADSPPISAAEQQEIDARDLAVAREGRRPGLVLERSAPASFAPKGSGGAIALRDWGLDVLDRMEPVAALLDADGEGYSAALAAQRDAIRHPDATPSARLLDALLSSRTGFFDYMLEVAKAHHEYFVSSEPSAGEAELAAAVPASLAEQRRLEEQDAKTSFGAYLERYFAEA